MEMRNPRHPLHWQLKKQLIKVTDSKHKTNTDEITEPITDSYLDLNKNSWISNVLDHGKTINFQKDNEGTLIFEGFADEIKTAINDELNVKPNSVRRSSTLTATPSLVSSEEVDKNFVHCGI